ncbi:MAG: hypothetical protein KBE09_01960 [Candidatus Pacebacteria bacterium]|nr:hypothetical protein [Candidatus Paceibacterota bacterium]
MPTEEQDKNVQAIITELNIGHLSQEEQDEILDTLGDIALKRVLMTVFDRIPEAERDVFQDLLEKNDQEGIQKLLGQHVPEFSELVADSLKMTVEEHKRLVGEEVGFVEEGPGSGPMPV